MLNFEQNNAFTHIKNGKNIFITGSAGTGKSHLLKHIINWIKKDKYPDSATSYAITSTTGLSACYLNGTTIHSFSGVGIAKGDEATILKKILSNSYTLRRWKKVQIILIDEVSLLTPIIFDMLDKVGKIIKKNDNPFGGIQLIVSGDFLQLKPIQSDKFCFESESWINGIKNVVMLTEIIRQDDVNFKKCLDEIRIGILSKESETLLRSRINITLDTSSGIIPTKLYSHKSSVDSINNKNLTNLINKGEKYLNWGAKVNIYTSSKLSDMDKKIITDKSIQSIPSDGVLVLSNGAQVMLTTNLDMKQQLVNGSRGVVLEVNKDYIKVKFLNNIEIDIKHHTWNIQFPDFKSNVEIIQMPLKLAYALTIHKSIGATLDLVELDIGNSVFDYGQIYVALSRVRTLEGMNIMTFDKSKIKAHPRVLEFYKSFSKN